MRRIQRILNLNEAFRTDRTDTAPPVALAEVRVGDRPVEFARAVVRQDTGEPLAVVSRRYTLVAHGDILAAIDQAVAGLGIRPEDVPRGVYYFRRGARMACLYKFPSLSRDLVAGDTLCPLVRVVNSYDATSRVRVEIGAFRFVCTNLSIGGGGVFASGFASVHAGDIDINRVREDLTKYLGHFGNVLGFYRSLMNRPWRPEDAEVLRKEIGRIGEHHASLVPDGGVDLSAYEVYNHLTDYATSRTRSARVAFRLLDAVNHAFQHLSRDHRN